MLHLSENDAMSILTVGSGQQFSTISAAVAASQDGDTVQVQAGTYVNDFATVNTKITIEGVGGMVHLLATMPPPNGKAILTTNTDVTLDHLELSGAAVADQNGAGVRYQGGSLVMTNCYVHDNQDGILGDSVPAGTISISSSEFSYNGTGDGSTHNIYVGDIASLTIDSSYIHDAVVGHEIKSRAENTTITNSRIQDGATGTASYSIDLPNGGNVLIQGNVIQQGPASQNPAIIAFGEEGGVHAGSALNVTGNTILNDLTSPSASAVWNATGAPASVTGNSIYGLAADHVILGAAAASGNVALATEPTLVTTSPWASAATPTVPASTASAPTPAPVIPTSSTGTPTPTPITPITLALHLSEDAYQGDAQFIVKVDGQALGQAQPVTALHALGQTQDFTFNGSFTVEVHDLTVSFINDAWGGTAATDRNLYINSVDANGTQLAASNGNLFSAGDFHIPFTVPASTPV
jgi:hypothetical protein